MPAHIVAKVNFDQALIYLRASGRLLDSVTARNGFQSGDDAIAAMGDATMGLIALESGLNGVRWAVANSPGAESRVPPPGAEEMTRFWTRVNPLRHYIVHFDRRISTNPLTSLAVDTAGVHAGSGHAIGFDEWRGWLGVLEPWVWSECMRPAVPSADPARAPDWVAVPTGEGPLASEAQIPPPGVVWFGSGLVHPEAHMLEGRGLRFEPGATVWLTATFVRETSGVLRIEVTAPDAVTYLVESFGSGSATANVVSMKLTGFKASGMYVVALKDESNEVLASGQLQITARSPIDLALPIEVVQPSQGG
jgi:hypothetical protein